jgi:hypothetical protein
MEERGALMNERSEENKYFSKLADISEIRLDMG